MLYHISKRVKPLQIDKTASVVCCLVGPTSEFTSVKNRACVNHQPWVVSWWWCRCFGSSFIRPVLYLVLPSVARIPLQFHSALVDPFPISTRWSGLSRRWHFFVYINRIKHNIFFLRYKINVPFNCEEVSNQLRFLHFSIPCCKEHVWLGSSVGCRDGFGFGWVPGCEFGLWVNWRVGLGCSVFRQSRKFRTWPRSHALR